MLIILLFLALIRILYRIQLSSPLELPAAYAALNIRDTQSHLGERAVSDIVISCFTTILACTFSAVHPNIPATTDGAWTRFKNQFAMMVYALLLPEAITAWALRQRLAARKIANIYNRSVATDEIQETYKSTSMVGAICAIFRNSPLPRMRMVDELPRWTLTHSFFFQMGGFMLSEGGRPIQTLNTYWEKHGIGWNMENVDIQVERPLITEEDIQDRSKNDAISKTLIILQTTWFIAQCIARWLGHLPVTELEVVTLGFAMLNGITYGLWWHKPQNVGRPVLLEIKRQILEEKSDNPSEKDPKVIEAQADSKEASIQKTAKPESNIQSEVRERSGNSGAQEPEIPMARVQPDVEKASIPKNAKPEHSVQQGGRAYVEKHGYSAPAWMGLYLIPFHFNDGLLRLLGKIKDYDHQDLEPGDLRLEMFYSRNLEDRTVYGITTIVGVHFGLVHLIPSWFLAFVSVPEMWLWRVSATIITVGPIFLNLWEYSYRKKSYWESTFRTFLAIMFPLYLVSRVVLMTISLTSLRLSIPADLQTIEWTTFIPHI